MPSAIAVLSTDNDVSIPVGAATVIAPELLLTCAHVLRDGGYARESGNQVRLRIAGRTEPASAKLLDAPWIPSSGSEWPRNEDLPYKLDWVALRLSEPLARGPSQLRALALSDAGVIIHSFGFPEGHPEGWEAYGRIASSSDFRELRQLEAVDQRSGIELGFSGGPVFDEKEATLGIVVSRSRPGSGDLLAAAGFMIPLDVISRIFQESNVPELTGIRIEPSVVAKYRRARDLLQWAEQRLQKNPYGAQRATPLLPLSLAVSKSIQPGEAFSQIEQLHIGTASGLESYFDLLDPRDFCKSQDRNYYVQAPGGAGKSFFLYELILTSVTAGVLPIFISAISARKSIAEVFAKQTTEERLRTLFEVSGSKISFSSFKKASEAGQEILLMIDGLNEASAEISRVVLLIENIRAQYENVQILMTDRMSFRSEYPDSFTLATISPLTADQVLRILPGEFASGYDNRLLRIPFFLDLVRESGPRRVANRKAVILRYITWALRQDDSAQPAVDPESEELLSLAKGAFDAYAAGKLEVRQGNIKPPGDQEPTPLARLLEAGLLTQVSSGSYRFRHQLIHDCLAAHGFTSAKLPADAANLKILTLDRRSSDALGFVVEGLEKAQADNFIVEIYDWDWGLTLSCLLETRTDSTDALATAICAVIAEKLEDTFLHTRQRTRPRLSALKRFIGVEAEWTSVQDIVAQLRAREALFREERLRRWWLAFTAETPRPELWHALVGNDPLSGWSAAAALRRVARGEETVFEQLAVLYEALKSHPEAASHLTSVRWRIVHVLGRFPQAISLLLDIGFDPTEDPDVQYGAIRESIEIASAGREEEGRATLGRALEKLNARGETLSSRPLCSFRKCAILKERADQEPAWWRDAYRPVLMCAAQFAKRFEDEYPQWSKQIDRFEANERDASN
ncbi:MAG: trypsin-like peptidase domain-containing protein [Acidobacteriaceae bacterium]|nr:trypsin-like peptidase domain-containing protein [Acidobacteriaceae bacterium]